MSNIKRGYPNPNYTEEDILPEEEAELNPGIGIITIDADRYEELVSKAAALDILTADIRSKIDSSTAEYNLVNDSLVMAVTGMGAYRRRQTKEAENE